MSKKRTPAPDPPPPDAQEALDREDVAAAADRYDRLARKVDELREQLNAARGRVKHLEQQHRTAGWDRDIAAAALSRVLERRRTGRPPEPPVG